MKIVLASTNRHKHEEFSDFFGREPAFAEAGVQLLCGGDLPRMPDGVAETGNTYEENALIKARAWADASGLPAIADDSGLEVKSLAWGPGVYSARSAPGSDSDRIRWLLRSLEGATDRRARFVACLVVVFGSRRERDFRDYFSVTGCCWGKIASAPSGSEGFGYDPVFVPDGYDRSFAELGASIKAKISHRAIAMQGVAQIVPSVLKYLSVYDSINERDRK